jgi:uncharacterized membrane protein YfcA
MNLDPLWILIAGIGGGLTGSVAGLASLVSYPALLAIGLPPVTANVTNTVALVFSSAGSIMGSRPELVGQRRRARHLALFALSGGVTGGLLLLATPSKSFALIVPWLIGLASVGVLIRRYPARTAPSPARRPGWVLSGGVFCICIYGGYFGAAAGVLMLTLLLLTTGEQLARSNAMRNVLLGIANSTAAVAFAIFGPVRWTVVLPLAIGCFVGGRIGPVIVRHFPTGPLRALIACLGVGLAVHLGIDAYR